MLRKLVFAVIVIAAALFVVGAAKNGRLERHYANPIKAVAECAATDVSTGARVVLEKGSEGAGALADRF